MSNVSNLDAQKVPCVTHLWPNVSNLDANEFPLAIVDVVREVDGVRPLGHVDLEAIVRPRTKLQVTHLEG